MPILAASVLQNAVHFFVQGGIFMIFLLALSVTALTVIILRGAALKEKSVIPPLLAREVDSLQPGDSLDSLQALLEKDSSPLGRVLETMIKHLAWPRGEVIEAVQTRARHEVAHMERGLVMLEIATGVAPLLGLLGTLSGLVGIFSSIGTDPTAVARGISEALNTTIVGLAVSVPCLTFYNYFQRRIEVMAIEMESLVSDLIAKCYPHGASPTIEKID